METSQNLTTANLHKLQIEVLSALFRAQSDDSLVLKGGWAMQANYGVSRYTKDIDLAAPEKANSGTIKRRINRALHSVMTSGLASDFAVSESKQTGTTQRWKLSAKVDGEPIHLTIEVSKRQTVPPSSIIDVAIQRGDGTSVNASSYSPPMLAAAKFACILDPKRTAPRDAFDLKVLIDNGAKPDADQMSKLARHPNFTTDFLASKLDTMSWDVVRTELVPYLDPSVYFSENDWEEMKNVVFSELSSWIENFAPKDDVADGGPKPK